MSKKKVVTTKKKKPSSPGKKQVLPTSSRSRTSGNTIAKQELIFGKQNYIYMAVGVGLIILGMILMSGGGMDNPEEWKPEVIYGWRRTLIAPICILAGLGIQIYAIFLRNQR